MNLIMNNIYIEQCANQYKLYLPTEIYIGHLICPPNCQYLQDAKALEHVTKAMALRWGIYENKNKKAN